MTVFQEISMWLMFLVLIGGVLILLQTGILVFAFLQFFLRGGEKAASGIQNGKKYRTKGD